MRAKPSKLLDAAKDLIERRRKAGLPPLGPTASPDPVQHSTKGMQRTAQVLTQELLQRVSKNEPPQS